MMWEGVYQSLRCWELPESFTTPCQSSTVPQVQIGVRPIIGRTAAVRAISATADPASAILAPFDRPGPDAREAAPAISDPRIHPARIENPGRIEGGLDAALERHQRVGLRLEHVEGGADFSRGADQGGMATEGSGRFAQDGGACIAVEQRRDPDEPAAPIEKPLCIESLRHMSGDVGPFRR